MSNIIIRASDKDSNDSIIKRFQKKVALEQVIPELRNREFHKKKSILRQEMRAERLRKIRRAQRLAT